MTCRCRSRSRASTTTRSMEAAPTPYHAPTPGASHPGNPNRTFRYLAPGPRRARIRYAGRVGWGIHGTGLNGRHARTREQKAQYDSFDHNLCNQFDCVYLSISYRNGYGEYAVPPHAAAAIHPLCRPSGERLARSAEGQPAHSTAVTMTRRHTVAL